MTRSGTRTPILSWIGSAGCATLALLLAPKEGGAVPKWLRDFSAPLVLPELWNAVDDARRNGSLGEIFERARTLVRFLPTWSDGPIHFAALLAFEASQQQTDPELALDRLLAAVTWLDQNASERPAQAGDLLAAMALFVQIRTQQNPELAKAFTRRLGKTPLEAADAWLARSETTSPLASTAQRRAWLALRQIAAALRMGADDRAAALAEIALARLAPTDSRLNVAEFRNALELARVAAHRGANSSAADLEALASEPLLAEIHAALLARARPK